MSNYPFLDKLATEELMDLQQMLILNPNFINEQISNREDCSALYKYPKDYTVKGVITAIDEVESKTLEVLSNIKLTELDFLKTSFSETGNNKRKLIIPIDFVLYDKKGYEIAKSYDIRDFVKYKKLSKESKDWFDDIEPIKDILNRSSYISYLEEFFKDPDTIKLFPGALNTYNYIKAHLYEVVDGNSSSPIAIRDSLFEEYESKVKIVTENFHTIASELLFVRESIPKEKMPRLSISNDLLKSYVRNQEYNVSRKQQLLINAIAFGTSLESLDNQDYSDSKRLIFTKK